ncbi:MAG: proprotein convertase P-domain-containing protein [Rhizonema sp. PD38]|nr:proprotein convertase P-domain-containing protein [Rhizonema sp. PD38]
MQEGRRFSPFLDINFYLSANNDVAKAFNNNREQALNHLKTNGLSEGRQFSEFFNPDYYKQNNPDLAANRLNSNQQVLQHFELYGVNENRQFSIPFDTTYYRNTYGDLKNLDNRQLFNHFQQFGLNEGRASSKFFNVSYYLANNSDLKAQNFNYYQAYNHFVLNGFAQEGRYGTSDGYGGDVVDTGKGTGTRSIHQTPSNPGNYEDNSNFNGSIDNIQFAKGKPRQTLILNILDDNLARGDKTVIWQISNSVPFGFSQATYQVNESNTQLPIEVSLGSNIKTTTIIIKDSEILHSFAGTNTPVSIPDGKILTSNVSVSALSGIVKDVNVKLNISHPRDSDLSAVLISPKGTQVKLFSNIGGNGANFTNTTLDDQSNTSIFSGTAPFQGTFSPENTFSSFNGGFYGENPNGTWKLQITDSVSGMIGNLNSWSLELTN